jgi:hypothetical protein
MDGKKALELVLALYKSAAEGCSVKFPLTDTDFRNPRWKIGAFNGEDSINGTGK